MNMTDIFSQVLNMSLTASVVILCVLAARFLLGRAPKIFSYALWAVVLFRLLCPVSLTSPVSVLEVLDAPVAASEGIVTTVNYLPAENRMEPTEHVTVAIVEQEPAVEEAVKETKLDLHSLASRIWLVGLLLMGIVSLMQYIQLRLRLVGAVCLRGRYYLADHIDTPFVMGIFRPKIYLPSNVPVKERRFIIAHERHHIRRGDHIVKLAAYAALCIHWFNPLVWIAFVLAGKDMEMSCDEAVIRKLGSQIRADYSESLLRIATGRRIIAGTPLAFGEGDTKGRVRNMAKWKKPKLWVSVLCLVICVVVLAVCIANPENERDVGDLTRVSGEAYCGYGDMYYILPEGFTVEARERTKEELKNGGDALYDQIFTDGTNVIGGITQWDAPDFELQMGDDPSQYNMLEWVQALGLPEAQEDTAGIASMVGGSKYGHLEAEYFNELNPEELNVEHCFFIWGDVVYDLWYDQNLVDDLKMEELLATVYFEKSGAAETEQASQTSQEPITGIPIQTNVDLVGYGDLTMALPEGYSARESEDGVILSLNGQDMGGIACWAAPEISLEMNNTAQWVRALGLPEAQENPDLPIASMIGGSVYGDAEAWFCNELEPEKLNVTHVFLISGEIVYDVYYDLNVISDGQAEKLLKTIQLSDEPVVPEDPSEESSLEMCRAVLEGVQSGSYGIVRSENDSSAGSVYRYGGYTLTDTEELPWLVFFKWNENTVAYIDTLTDANGICVMLRIDEKYPYGENNQEHYWVNFNFDSEGNFINVYKQVNLFMDNAFTEYESILSADDWSAAEETNR